MDKLSIRKICIDDFALKKREKYATVMIDIETRKVVDILNSRDLEDVKKWLSEYPNIELVCRDGSITYNKAIKDSHREAIQVGDRFHILKNLTDYLKSYIKRTVKNAIEITDDTNKNSTNYDQNIIKSKYQYNTRWELILAVQAMQKDGNTIKQISDILGLGNKTVIKYSKITEDEKDKYNNKTTPEIKKENSLKLKNDLIKEVKEFRNKGLSFSKIGREMGLSRQTVKKYSEINGNFIHGGVGKKHKSKLDIYKETIISLLQDGVSGSTIYKKIKENGYEGSSSLVRTFIAELRKGKSNNLGILKEKILRRSLISLLYKEIDSVKDIAKDQLNKVLNIYPELKIIYDIAKDFKVLLFSKKEFDLEIWIQRAKNLNIKELNSFISGIERDLEAVKNSIKYELSNGLAEGTVNKIKVIKRIMYGRCSFELLRKKVLLQNFN